MIITDDHVYIHMPKTGGTWVKHFLLEELGGTGVVYQNKERISGHVPAHRIKGMFPDKIFVGSIRDVHAWYLSWYHLVIRGFSENKKNQRAYYYLKAYSKVYDPNLEFHNPNEHTFKAIMYGITHLEKVEPLKQDLLFSPWSSRPEGGGLYTQSVWWYYKSREGEWLIDEWVHTESLEKDVRTLYGVNSNIAYPPRNVGTYDRGCKLFDDEIYSWVEEADLEDGGNKL